MGNQKRFMVFHRNRLFRDCLATFLSTEGGHEATPVDHIAVGSGEPYPLEPADVVLLDLNLPDGIAMDVARAASDEGRDIKIIVLVPDEHDGLVECIALGVHGCVLERSSLEDLHEAIARVLGGENFCSPDIVSTMFAEIGKLARTKEWQPPARRDGQRLTAREQEVLELLNQRKSNKEIASELCVSLYTVKNHVHSVLAKLNAENRMEAADIARSQKRVRQP